MGPMQCFERHWHFKSKWISLEDDKLSGRFARSVRRDKEKLCVENSFPTCQTDHQEFYCDVLKSWKENILWKLPYLGDANIWIFHWACLTGWWSLQKKRCITSARTLFARSNIYGLLSLFQESNAVQMPSFHRWCRDPERIAECIRFIYRNRIPGWIPKVAGTLGLANRKKKLLGGITKVEGTLARVYVEGDNFEADDVKTYVHKLFFIKHEYSPRTF